MKFLFMQFKHAPEIVYIAKADTLDSPATYIHCPAGMDNYRNITIKSEMRIDSSSWIYKLYDSLEELMEAHLVDLL